MTFQLSNQYYDLIAFSNVPTQVFDALEDCSHGAETYTSHAKFQLGLCYVSGFGTNRDLLKGLMLIHEAAVDGSRRARTVIARFHRAFGIPIPISSRETFFIWLSESARLGSRIAIHDLTALFPESQFHTRKLSQLPDGRWNRKLITLCESLRKGEKIYISPQDVSVGPIGDSILHWCAFLPQNLGGRIATLLMNQGCSPVAVTEAECPIGQTSEGDSYCEVMPSRTTPIDWAIIEGNMEVLKLLLQASQRTDGDITESPAFTPTTCAARFQRFECLKYILESGYNVSECDKNGCTPVYHAIRPDFFTRILQFSEPSNTDSITRLESLQQPETFDDLPFVRLEIAILQLLQGHGTSLETSPQDELNYLHLAVAAKDSQVLEHLLRTENLRGCIDQPARGEWSPLCYAVALGNERAIDLLLSYGANVNLLSHLHGYNALHICAIYARANSTKIALKLISRSHKLVNSRSRSGYTALHFAAVAGSVSLINTLAARGAHLVAASNLVTPLGLAIIYWSELGVEEMCNIHAKRKVPLIAAFHNHWNVPMPSAAVGPLTLMLYPDLQSTIRVQELRGRSSQAGCYNPPITGPMEDILRMILRYSASGNSPTLLKGYYYEFTEQYGTEDSPRRNLFTLFLFIVALFVRLIFLSVFFFLYEIHEASTAIKYLTIADDSRAVEIFLAEFLHQSLTRNLRYLILKSQLHLSRKSVHERQHALRTANLLIERQYQSFSQLKHRRINGILRVFWRLIYRLYLDIEQQEYMRFNEWVVQERPHGALLKTEFRSWFRPTRISLYSPLFALLWAILGPMVYYMSSFIRNINEPVPPSSVIWTVFLLVVVSIFQGYRDLS